MRLTCGVWNVCACVCVLCASVCACVSVCECSCLIVFLPRFKYSYPHHGPKDEAKNMEGVR